MMLNTKIRLRIPTKANGPRVVSIDRLIPVLYVQIDESLDKNIELYAANLIVESSKIFQSHVNATGTPGTLKKTNGNTKMPLLPVIQIQED